MGAETSDLRRSPIRTALCLVLATLASPGPSLAARGDAEPPADRGTKPASAPNRVRAAGAGGTVDRFEYYNDLFIARDDAGFSGGFGQQRFSPPLSGWATRPGGGPRRAWTRWIGEHLPGLAPARDRVLRFGSGFTHTTQTPDDLRTAELQTADVPYAGTLGAHWSWVALDERRLNAFQIYTGVLGPAAAADAVHDVLHAGLARGPEPRGWRWQLGNEPLVNLSYAVRRKLAETRPGDERGWRGDLAVGLHQALGNYHTATDLQLEFRAGPRLPGGFAQVPDVAGQGINMQPLLGPAETGGAAGRWRLHTSFVVRLSGLWYTPLLDRSRFTDAAHPGVGYDPLHLKAVVGLHLSRGRISFHLSYCGSGLAPELSPDSRTSPSWLNVTFEYRD